MNVSVFGLGYVGCVTAACLASQGHRVVGVDVNVSKVDAINGGASPIVEMGLNALIETGQKNGSLRATCAVNEAVAHGEALVICVGTPSDANGNLNFEFIDRVCLEIGRSLREVPNYRVIAVRSTMLPGTIVQRVIPLIAKESGKQIGNDFGIVSNPEFLREGSAIEDFKNPPFTLIGETDEKAGKVLEQLYSEIPAPIFHTDPDTASMVKYACNAFHGLKVVFANEIGKLSKKAGIDGTQVMEIFCRDTRLNISPRYLKPGFAFGGSCLPKDLRALLYWARHSDLQMPVLESILPSNRLQVDDVVNMILKGQRNRVGVLGLTFKSGTDDLRESPMVELVEILSGKGIRVRIYDENISLPTLIGSNRAFIEKMLPHISDMVGNSMEEVIQDSDVIVVAHELQDGGEQLLDLVRPDQLIIDFVGIPLNGNHSRVAYEGLGW